MDVDWWARGIGLTAMVIALFSLALRAFEIWRAGRADLKVIGSAGKAQITNAGPYLVRGRRFGYSLVLVDIINKGKRPVVVEQAGFVVPGSDHRSVTIPGVPDLLPKRLEPGDSVTVTNDAQSFFEHQTEDLGKIRPYCQDAERKTHLGKVDGHFRQLVEEQGQKDD